MKGELNADGKVTTNQLRKGDVVRLSNGWWATVMDNMRGTTRLCEVEGFVTELGSVYAHEIADYYPDGKGGRRIGIAYTKAQMDLHQSIAETWR